MAGQTVGTAGEGDKQVFSTALTETATYDKEGLGAIRKSGNKWYKWVRYGVGAGTVAAVAGNVVGYTGGSTPVGHQNNAVTSDVSDCVGIGAGVLMSAPADTEYCWIQIRGFATINTALVSGSDGNALILSATTDGTLKVSAAVTDCVCAFAEDASLKYIICNFPF